MTAARPAGHPLRADEFARLMAALAPFEARPRLAIGVSGGADSSALALLAGEWARARGGEAVALVVDHRLRPQSTAEALLAARRCRHWGLTAQVLAWEGAKPATAIEETARTARHALLERACLRLGALHLLLAHHRDDQAETVAMRRQRGSGSTGLAGMSACVERAGYRLLRPLLAIPQARLAATLEARGVGWIDDPMNRDPRFARARLRRDGAPAAQAGAGGTARLQRESALAIALARLATLDPFGVACLDRARWRRLEDDVALAVLARLALAVGGGVWPPRGPRLAALARRLRGPETVACTLGRCLWRGGESVAVLRERRYLPVVEAEVAKGRRELLWDGRFCVALPPGRWRVQALSALGGAGAAFAPSPPAFLSPALARLARDTLPAVCGVEGVAAVPHLGYARDDAAARGCRARFAPRQPLAGPLFMPAGGAGAAAAGPP